MPLLSEEAAQWINIARSLDQNIRSLSELREAFIIQHYEPELDKDDDAQKKPDKKEKYLESVSIN